MGKVIRASLTGLRGTPMPSMSTSTTSPGVSVTAWLIQLTMAGGAKSRNLDPASGG
jgi:hypothetical protein